MTGIIYSGINNIYRVRDNDGRFYECRIKGKILDKRVEYNPLSPGDRVEFITDDPCKGLITRRHDRHNRFARWNKKRNCWQVIAANIDALVAVICVDQPPFRPRFVERVLIAASLGKVPSRVLINKIDLPMQKWVQNRLDIWKSIGIVFNLCSTVNGQGIAEFQREVEGKTIALLGPSGVGKSSIINALVPDLNLNTGAISTKHNRGCHVTNFGQIIDAPWGGRIIDTPGIREIQVKGIKPLELQGWFPEISDLLDQCQYQPCSHRHEPGCAVQRDLNEGKIDVDRYENYLRIMEEIALDDEHQSSML